MPYTKRKFSESERQKGQYASEKIFQIIKLLPFEIAFDVLAGVLFGISLSHMTMEEIIEKIGWLTEHDSPDGRTSEQLIEAFRRGKAS